MLVFISLARREGLLNPCSISFSFSSDMGREGGTPRKVSQVNFLLDIYIRPLAQFQARRTSTNEVKNSRWVVPGCPLLCGCDSDICFWPTPRAALKQMASLLNDIGIEVILGMGVIFVLWPAIFMGIFSLWEVCRDGRKRKNNR